MEDHSDDQPPPRWGQGTVPRAPAFAAPMRRIAAALLFTVSSGCFADQPAVALGYQFLPLLPAGLSLSLLDTFGLLGIEATLGGAGSSRTDHERTTRFSASFGVNFATPINPIHLYPSVAISAEHTRHSRGDAVIEKRTVWGMDTKLTVIVYSPVAITVGYRAPFEEPFAGSVIFGVSLILLRQTPVP